jgi:hypothetical protein
MFPVNTDSIYLQRKIIFLGFFCVVTRGTAEPENGSGRVGAGERPAKRLVGTNS